MTLARGGEFGVNLCAGCVGSASVMAVKCDGADVSVLIYSYVKTLRA